MRRHVAFALSARRGRARRGRGGSGRRRQAPAAAGARHPVEGKAVSVDAARRSITIAHQDIPGFMPAMTMELVVLERDAPLLARVSPADEVTATLVVADTRYWLEDLVVVKKGTSDPNARPGRDVREAQPGDVLPDVALVDQDGRSFRLSGLRGKAYALTFVFTRCPLPDFCPLLMRHFASARGAAGRGRVTARAHAPGHRPSFDTATTRRRCCGASAARSRRRRRPSRTGVSRPARTRRSARSAPRSSSTTSRRAPRSPTTCARPWSTRTGRLVRLFRGNDWQPDELSPR